MDTQMPEAYEPLEAPKEENRGATKWFQKEGKGPQKSYGNIIDARRRGVDSHDSRGPDCQMCGRTSRTTELQFWSKSKR
jgi:hypothetical protein